MSGYLKLMSIAGKHLVIYVFYESKSSSEIV